MHIGEKIRQIRAARGFSQENLARDIGCATSTVSRIESGQLPPAADTLRAIREALGIAHAPLLPGEAAGFKERLCVWQRLIAEKHLTEAAVMQENLSAIVHLPFEPALAMLYELFEVRFFIARRDFDGAKCRLDALSARLGDMDDEARYHFYYSAGLYELNVEYQHAEDALENFLAAHGLQDAAGQKDGWLCYCIARCHTRLGRPFRSIDFIERARRIYGDDIPIRTGLALDNKMALNRIDTGETGAAREILCKCLENAKAIGDESCAAVILHNIGSTYLKDKDWGHAMDYFKQAEACPQASYNKMENAYSMARCLVGQKRYRAAKELIVVSAAACACTVYPPILFEALGHLMSLRESDSRQYLEEVTIPYLLKKRNIDKSLDYCEMLEAYYESRGNAKKALAIVKIQRDIYKNMVMPVETG